MTGERAPGAGRDYALYGYFDAGVNVTDSRYTCFHPVRDGAPVELYSAVQPPGADDATPASLPYTELPVWCYERASSPQNVEPLLFDTADDSGQETNPAGERPAVVDRMCDLLGRGLDDLDAPASQYDRLAL